MIIDLLKGLLPQLGVDENAPIEKQAAVTHQIERILARWFAQKKAASGDARRTVLMFDLDAQAILRMVPSKMYDPSLKPIPADELVALIDAAFRTLSVQESNEERAAFIRSAHAQVKDAYALVNSGSLIEDFVVDQGVNVTNWAQRIAIFKLIIPMMEQFTSGPSNPDNLTPDQQADMELKVEQMAELMISLLRDAAHLPECRLVRSQPIAERQLDPAQLAPPQPIAETTTEPTLSSRQVLVDNAEELAEAAVVKTEPYVAPQHATETTEMPAVIVAPQQTHKIENEETLNN